ncbi:MAG: DNA polymerase I [Oscillospiraceae bacterium]
MKFLCLDANSIVNRAYYAIRPLTTKEGIYTNAIFGFVNILFKLIDDVKPDAVVCAFDLKAPTFRHKKYDAYKAGRKGMPDELGMQLPFLKDIITSLGYDVVSLEGYEADDILGTFAKHLGDNGHQCYIATGDRDSLQLISKDVTVLLSSSSMGKPQTTICDENYVMEKYGVTPEEMIDVKALMGDSSDNIPGVAGIGEKTALKLITQYKNIDYIYDHLDEIEATPSVRKKLTEGKDSAYLSRELGTIYKDVPINLDFEHYLIEPMDKQKTFAILTKLEMTSFIKKFGLENEVLVLDTASTPKTQNEIINLLYNDEKVFEEIKENDDILLFSSFNEGILEEYAIIHNNKIYLFDNSCAKLEENFIAILKSPINKSTFSCKDIFYYSQNNGFEPNNISFDIVLAAYLLDANAKSYDKEILLNLYGIQPNEINIENLSTEADQAGIMERGKEYDRLSQLYKILKAEIDKNQQLSLLQDIEIPLANVLVSMEIQGFYIDKEELARFGEKITVEIHLLEENIYSLAGEEFNINSPKQLGEILFVKLGLPAKKKTKTGFSTGAEVLEELRGSHEIIDSILKYRQLAKLKSTYVEGLAKEISTDGKIHSHFNQTETRTGRISSTEPNMQNIPVRTPLGRELRRFFKATEGNVLIDADYSQIELRVLAHISGDKNMIDAFKNGEDIHEKTASQVFNLPPLFITPELRSRAKAVNFGIVYGIGAFSLSKDIGVSVKEADSYIKSYLEKFSSVKEYMDKTIAFAKENGYVKTLFNRKRNIPEIKSSNHNLRAFGERVAMNMPIQGTAADIIKIAMVKVYNRLKKENLNARLILQVHDELIVSAPKEEADLVSIILKEEMENAVSFSVRLTADTSTGESWYDAK